MSTTFTPGDQDIDHTDFDGEYVPTRASFRQAVETVATHARERLPECNGRVDAAVKLVLAGDVELLPDGSAHIFSASQAGTVYRLVSGACSCRDYPQAPHGFCKHRLSVAILRRARTVLDAPTSAPEPEHTPPAEAPADIPAQFLTHLHGKVFVQYAGLLALAHARGLVSLSAAFLHVSPELATATATATFSDGRSFSECADATPNNVGRQIAPHFARMALTRAKARCLRDALNVSMCSLEEIE